MCVATCSFLSLADGLFLEPARTLQSAVLLLLHHLSSHISSFPDGSTLALADFLHLHCATLHPWSYKFVCDARATHCPCRRTGPTSSTHTHTSMVYTPLFTSSCGVSIVSNARIHPAQRHCHVARPSFLFETKGLRTFALLNFMQLRTLQKELKGLAFSSIFLHVPPRTNFFVASFDPLHISAGMCGSCAHRGPDVHQVSLNSMTFLRRTGIVITNQQYLILNVS